MIRCARCGRILTQAMSTYLGLGPVCRKVFGVVAVGGLSALEALRWVPESRSGFNDAVNQIDQALAWWDLRASSHRGDFSTARQLVVNLGLVDHSRGATVLGLVMRLVSLVRFDLEPMLASPAYRRWARVPWIEGVPELRPIMDGAEAILAGIGAGADALDLRDLRLRDIATIREGRTVRPAPGVEDTQEICGTREEEEGCGI